MRPLRTLLAAAAALAALTAASGALAATPRTVIFNLSDAPLSQPDRVFFQADSGPYLKDLRWTDWGTATSVGTGTWELDCSNGGASCGDSTAVTTYPATYTVSGLAACPRFGPAAQTYRKGTIVIDMPGGPVTKDWPSASSFCRTPPTKVKAEAAVARYVRLHQHVAPRSVSCGKLDGTARECTARWRTAGRTHKGSFDVTAGAKGRVRVQAFG